MSSDHSHNYDTMKKEYLKIFFALLVFTALTVLAAKIDGVFGSIFGHTLGVYVNMSLGLIIASLKVAMVMYIFMHLKFDAPFIRFFVAIPLFLFVVMVFAFTVLENFI